ncbi:serine protease inhibitor Kazal-type 1 [Trichechus manatus latirostris]|uniref:Serine protease inhibitor Kazal-type 1 n=1 Tax=Trichechus manatus latirostris TaxID=127582 RepID=A0A2Y9E249_TRIMA|nr:serine protease inhibitor Kazal-type 1 [Trichechus manatus latirostris]
MKIISIFLLSALALFSLSGNTRANCLGREAVCPSDVNGCPRIYNPVCGTDGNTYSNECMLCFENKKRQIQVRVLKSGPC